VNLAGNPVPETGTVCRMQRAMQRAVDANTAGSRQHAAAVERLSALQATAAHLRRHHDRLRHSSEQLAHRLGPPSPAMHASHALRARTNDSGTADSANKRQKPQDGFENSSVASGVWLTHTTLPFCVTTVCFMIKAFLIYHS
jgi:hypothetical protein